MLKILKFVILAHLFPCLCNAQLCKGKVLEMETGLPIQNANVFLAGTSNGTTTMMDGGFQLDVKGNTSVPLIISFVGYVTKVISVDELSTDSIFRLKKEVREIDEVDVKSNPSDWPRSRMLRVFKEEFLGTSFNAQSCKIKNDDDIYLFYNSDTEVLHARSRNPIIIENKLLGYRFFYLLEYFRKSATGIQFKGYSRFEETEKSSDRKKNKTDLQRRETYLGSIMHFIRYLYDYDLTKNDTVYDLETINQIYVYHASGKGLLSETYQGDLNYTSLVSKNDINNILLRKYEDKFQMYDNFGNYLACNDMLIDTNGKRYIRAKDAVKIFYLGNMWKSYMVPKADTIEIYKDGYYNPEKIGWYGAMSKQRVGDMLPLEYKYDPTVIKKKGKK